jgi:Cd2+/Zn2+-exporting ATPase
MTTRRTFAIAVELGPISAAVMTFAFTAGLSRRCRRTIYTNVAIGLVWTVGVLALAVTGVLGASGALIAALAQNFSSVLVMINAGRLLKFQEALE